MTDLKKAKLLLEKEDLTIVLVKEGKVIFKSKDKGIRPMFIVATELKKESQGAALADRVIGKGAAILLGYVGISEVYGELISQAGIERLEYYKIPYSAANTCEYIKNREKNDYCPIEKISMEIEEPEILIKSIKEFLEKISKGGS